MEFRRRFHTLLIMACSTTYICIIFLNVGGRYYSKQRQDKGEEKLSRSLEMTEKTEKFSTPVEEVAETDTQRKRVRVWVLAGSMGRSGTSLMGELMAQEKPSIYLFEPGLFVRASTGTKVTEVQGIPFLRDMFECRFSEPFIEWLYTRSKGNVVRHPMTRRCKSARECFTVDSLSRKCLQEELMIIKVIRYRIRWLKEMLSDENYDMKLVYMIRDPRASLRSMWAHLLKLSPMEACPLIEDDLAQIQELQEKFPGRALRLEYENFCLDSGAEAKKLWRFLSDDPNANLPPLWLRFLEKHTHMKKSNKTPVFGTVRNTRQEYEAWRWEIKEDLLNETEKYCSSVISKLGHRLFGSLSVARNASLSLATG